MKKTRLGRYLATGLLTIACSMQMVFPSLAVDVANALKDMEFNDAVYNEMNQDIEAVAKRVAEAAINAYGMMVTLDTQGEMTGYSLAIPLRLGQDILFCANADAVTDLSAYYAWLTGDENVYVVEAATIVPEDHMFVGFAIEAGDEKRVAVSASAHQNEQAYMVYRSEDLSEYNVAQVAVTDGIGFDDGAADDGIYIAVLDVNGVPNKDIAFPAAVFNTDGECIAVAYTPEIVLSYSTPQSEFYGAAVTPEPEDPTPIETQPATQPAGEPTPQPTPQTDLEPDTTKYLLMGVIVVLAVVLIVTNSNKKNGNKNSYGSGDSRTISLGESVHQDTDVKLVGIGGYMDGKTFPVGSHEITLGRDSSCGIQYPVDAQGISRVHCKLYWKNGTLMLMDMNSSYGTFTETGKLEPMRPVPVKYGDVFFLSQKTNAFMIQ